MKKRFVLALLGASMSIYAAADGSSNKRRDNSTMLIDVYELDRHGGLGQGLNVRDYDSDTDDDPVIDIMMDGLSTLTVTNVQSSQIIPTLSDKGFPYLPKQIDQLNSYENLSQYNLLLSLTDTALKDKLAVFHSGVFEVSPLFIACLYKNTNLVKKILDFVKTDCKDDSSDSTSMINSFTAFPYFVDDFNDMTPLHIACYSGCEDIVQLLIENGAHVGLGNITPFQLACMYNRQKVTDCILAYYEGKDVQPLLFNEGLTRSTLAIACEFNNKDIVQRLYKLKPVQLTPKDIRLLTNYYNAGGFINPVIKNFLKEKYNITFSSAKK